MLKIIFFASILFSDLIFNNIKLHEIDEFRYFANPSSISIIENGSTHCNDFFENNKKLVFSNNKTFKNFFLCKYSSKRNRFYVYMLSQAKIKNLGIRESCINILNSWPWIEDHMDQDLNFQTKDYLKGFFVENIYNNKVLNFSNDLAKDSLIINNEIDNIITQRRKSFTKDNLKNNKIVKDEINKINKIYNKILSSNYSNLDKIIQIELNKIVRYKIFINDITTFTSYSCNWAPGKGLSPYIKKEKFSEFENS
tara:strand:+ start:3597 stop:4355 length:759 start_codon:yes stop_codon:yes gene_type:complete